MANAHWNFDEVAATVPEGDDHGSYTYRMYKNGPEVNASEVELPHSETVEVTISWGSNVLSTRHLAATQTFTVGEASVDASAVDFTLPTEKLGTARLPLVKRSNGTPVVVIPRDAHGTVTRSGQTSSLDTLRLAATASSDVAGAVEWPLPSDTEVRIETSDIAFVVRTTKAGKPVPHGIGSVDLAAASYFGASFLSAGALLAAAAFFMPPMGLTTGEATVDEQLLMMMPYLDASAEKEREPEKSENNEASSEGGTGERAVGEEGSMGKKESTQTNRRYAVKGDASNPDPHLARQQALREAARFGIIGLLSSSESGDPNAPTAPWGRDTSLGLDDVSAMGNMWGFEYIFGDDDVTLTTATQTGIPAEILEKCRKEFRSFYPVKLRVSGKDLIPNHLVFWIYNHVALFPKKFWPTGVKANGWLNLNNDKMSKRSGNFITLNEATKRYSADGMRFALAEAGDTLADSNFTTENADNAILRIHTQVEWFKVIFHTDFFRVFFFPRKFRLKRM